MATPFNPHSSPDEWTIVATIYSQAMKYLYASLRNDCEELTKISRADCLSVAALGLAGVKYSKAFLEHENSALIDWMNKELEFFNYRKNSGFDAKYFINPYDHDNATRFIVYEEESELDLITHKSFSALTYKDISLLDVISAKITNHFNGAIKNGEAIETLVKKPMEELFKIDNPSTSLYIVRFSKDKFERASKNAFVLPFLFTEEDRALIGKIKSNFLESSLFQDIFDPQDSDLEVKF